MRGDTNTTTTTPTGASIVFDPADGLWLERVVRALRMSHGLVGGMPSLGKSVGLVVYTARAVLGCTVDPVCAGGVTSPAPAQSVTWAAGQASPATTGQVLGASVTRDPGVPR
jgi:hypothetical protein